MLRPCAPAAFADLASVPEEGTGLTTNSICFVCWLLFVVWGKEWKGRKIGGKREKRYHNDQRMGEEEREQTHPVTAQEERVVRWSVRVMLCKICATADRRDEYIEEKSWDNWKTHMASDVLDRGPCCKKPLPHVHLQTRIQPRSSNERDEEKNGQRKMSKL